MLEHLRFICSGGSFDGVVRYSSCTYFTGLLQIYYGISIQVRSRFSDPI